MTYRTRDIIDRLGITALLTIAGMAFSWSFVFVAFAYLMR